jgi:NTP pyrophosphatase (non-canonical NTP hydrolase)
MLIEYRDERDWKQFHTLKNSASNISVEAGELLDHFRWNEAADDPAGVREEAADILYSLLFFCHDANIDLGAALITKLAKNAAKYPVAKAKGSPKKYNQL